MLDPEADSFLARAVRRSRPFATRQFLAARQQNQTQLTQLPQPTQPTQPGRQRRRDWQAELEARAETQRQLDLALQERLLALANMQQAFIRDLRSREPNPRADDPEFEERMRRVVELEQRAREMLPFSGAACAPRGEAPPRSDAASYPQWAVCPITLSAFVDPVIAQDGHTYERAAICKWLDAKRTSPCTGEPMPGGLISNFTVRRAVDALSEDLDAVAAKNASGRCV